MASDPSRVINDKLTTFLQCSAERKFDWVHCNCGFWVCEWIKFAVGKDPVLPYRGLFKTDIGFIRFVEKRGGYENFSRKIAQEAELVQTYTPQLGDVGLVKTNDTTMAIKADLNKWIVKTETGIAIAAFPCIIAWRI